MPVAGLFYVGRGRECPVCGARRRRFLPYGYVAPRADALCPSCLSLERHRLLWLYLTRETDLLRRAAADPAYRPRSLPDEAGCGTGRPTIRRPIWRAAGRTAFDVLQIPLPDASYDVLICNHLLEHVADDRRALGEFYRILRPGGWGILALARRPVARCDLRGRFDHRSGGAHPYFRAVRPSAHLWPRLRRRLREAGFEVREIDYAARFSAEERRRYALPDDWIYVVRRPL